MATERHFVVDYVVDAASEEEARKVSASIAHEQTVELPAAYVAETYPDISRDVVGKLVGLEKLPDDRWNLSIAYHEDTTGEGARSCALSPPLAPRRPVRD